MIIFNFDEASKPMSEHGALVITRGVSEMMKTQRFNVFHYFGRHIQGDWGDICDEDRKMNEEALIWGYRLMSVYDVTAELKVWIITEADRSVTTILLPEEY